MGALYCTRTAVWQKSNNEENIHVFRSFLRSSVIVHTHHDCHKKCQSRSLHPFYFKAIFLSNFFSNGIFALNFLFDMIMPSVHFFPFKILPYLVQGRVLHQNPQYRNPAFCSHEHVNRNEKGVKFNIFCQKVLNFQYWKLRTKELNFRPTMQKLGKLRILN